MHLNALLSLLPLVERCQALADMMGERLRPAFYSPTGDAGAVAQDVILKPASNEGPYVITGLKAPLTGTASAVRFSLNANGTQYISGRKDDGCALASFPSVLNAPIVVTESHQAITRFVAGAGAHGTIRQFFSGFHCSARFGEALRNAGETWADHIKIASTDGPKQLPPMERNTLLELISLPTSPTDAQLIGLNLRVDDVIVTPNDLMGTSSMWDAAVGFGRASTILTALSGRVPIRIGRGGVITLRSQQTAGTTDMTFVGRRVWVG